MQFSIDKNRRRSIFKSRVFITVFGISLLAVLIIWAITTSPYGADLISASIFLSSLAIAALIFSLKQKACGTFETNEIGILVKNKLVPWSRMRSYHWLGEAQGERFGAVEGTGYSLTDPYKNLDTKVARIKVRNNFLFNRRLNLEVEALRADELSAVLEQHGVNHESPWRLRLGV